MRVVIVAPPYYEIPPRGYGGTELICYLLAEGLIDRDHDVTVIGAGPRRTRARFVATFRQAQPEGEASAGRIEARHASLAAAMIREIGPDIVHVHTTVVPDIPPSIPTVITVHGAVSGPDAISTSLDALARRGSLVAISHAQAAAAPGARWAAVVPNGIDLSRYPVGGEREDLVVCLGRISPHKGTHLAIDAALAAGRPLVIAGAGTIPQERAYFDTQIRPPLGYPSPGLAS
jgi:glycosyltransferase involved in cell wall biosynthesis